MPENDFLAVRRGQRLNAGADNANTFRSQALVLRVILQLALKHIHAKRGNCIGHDGEHNEKFDEAHASTSLAGVWVSFVQHHTVNNGCSAVLVAW